MNRPYVICHMTVSLDGKVTGEHLVRSNHSPASEVYYEINRNYKADAYACGRITMEGSFTGGWYPDLSGFEPADCPMDYLVDKVTGFYAVAFDPHGRLVVDPVIGGEGKPLCMDSKVEEYCLVDVKNHDGILWLNYKK